MNQSSRGDSSLVRGLGAAAATSLVIGSVIGTGIFLKARVMMCNVETPGMMMAAWVAAGLLSLAGALTYAELAAMMPHTGGEYVFIREGYGKLPAFLYGWTQFAVAYTGSQAAKGISFAIFLNALVGGALTGAYFTVGGLEFGPVQVVAVSVVILATVVNCLAVAFGGKVSVFLTSLKIAIVVAIGASAFLLAQNGLGHFAMSGAGGLCEGVSAGARAGTGGLLAGFGAAMLGALWAYDGWSNVSIVAGEVKNPQRNLPLALIGGMLIVAGLYLFANLAYLNVLSPVELASVPKSSSVATEVARKFLGPSAVALIAMAMMISTLGSLHGGTMAGARVTYAMAKDGLFFAPFAKVSAKTLVPVGALLIQGAWSCVLALSGSFDKLTDYVMFSAWIFYGLNTASIFLFRRRYPKAERPYRALGYPVVPALFLLTTAWLLYNTVSTSPREALIGIGIIALGLPIYWARSRKTSRTRTTVLASAAVSD